MKPNQKQINYIQQQFQNLDNEEGLLELLNFSKKIIYKDKTKPFTIKQLNYYINKDSITKNNHSFYTKFKIKKKSGGYRTIHAPVKGLKELQLSLNLILQAVYKPHEAATGFVIGKSIVDNAKIHTNQNYVYNLDLKDFFPSIDAKRVWGRLTVAPFNLGKTSDKKQIANMIKTLCCTRMFVERFESNTWIKKNLMVLPQGAPTSPILTNAICERLDRKLSKLATDFGLNYSRYADDITFSSLHNSYKTNEGINEVIYKKDSTFDKKLRSIIATQNFHIKETKVRLQKKEYRQEVTGLSVNDKVNVSRRYTKTLRHWLYLWEVYGKDKAYPLFLNKYTKDKSVKKNHQICMSSVIEGKLLYLKMVKGDSDSTYLKLKERFEFLVKKSTPKLENNNLLIDVVDLILNKGLDKAMLEYKQ